MHLILEVWQYIFMLQQNNLAPYGLMTQQSMEDIQFIVKPKSLITSHSTIHNDRIFKVFTIYMQSAGNLQQYIISKNIYQVTYSPLYIFTIRICLLLFLHQL